MCRSVSFSQELAQDFLAPQNIKQQKLKTTNKILFGNGEPFSDPNAAHSCLMRSLTCTKAYYVSTVVISLLFRRAGALLLPGAGKNSHRTFGALRISMASSSQATDTSTKTLRVLALHGSEGTGPSFVERLEPLRQRTLKDNVDLELVSVTAPFSKGDGYAWWTMPPGVRSFTAKEFVGFEQSASLVVDTMEKKGPFEVVLGHSQGAILLSALLASGRISDHPSRGYVLNGVAVPNPYVNELERMRFEGENKPSVLFVLGENDVINPKTTGDKVKACMEKAGLDVSTCYHPGGHSVPVDDEAALETIAKWIIKD